MGEPVSRRRQRHNRYQRRYYESREKRTMRPRRSRYVTRQLERVVRAAALDPTLPVLEVGAGLGRYTIPLLERGFTVTALDLSPVMLDRLARRAASPRLQTVAGDLADAPRLIERRFPRAVGFFTLHHMHDLDAVLRGLAGVLEPGARVAFLEPNAYNPLYYVQIALTPGMTWRGDRGVVRMRRRVVLGAMERAGFTGLGLERFGCFPPFVTDRPWGARLEDRLQHLRVLEPVLAFQLFTGVWPG